MDDPVAGCKLGEIMDELNRQVSGIWLSGLLTRITAIGFAAILGIFNHQAAVAVQPEPLPKYSNSARLRADATLRHAAFNLDGIGIAVGDRGTILRSIDEGESWSDVASGVDSSLSEIAWVSSSQAVVVGGGYDTLTQVSRGVVLVTQDSGATWKSIQDQDLPRLRAVHRLSDGSVIAAGDWSHAQLSDEFISHDAGRSWASVGREVRESIEIPTQSASQFVRHCIETKTAVPARHRAVLQSNPTIECLVGDHGVIWNSKDRGKTWNVVRGADRKTAVMFVAADATRVPWSLVGAESLNWGSRTSVVVQQFGDAGQPNAEVSIQDQVEFSLIDRDIARQAGVAMGASSVDRFEQPNESESALVQAKRWIYVHQPSVVVLDSSLSATLRNAFYTAATAVGVQRVVSTSRDSQAGGSVLHANALLTHLGVLASDLSRDAENLVRPTVKPASETRSHSIFLRSIHVATSRASRLSGGESLLTGLVGRRSGRRAAPKVITRNRLQVVQARIKQSQLLGTSSIRKMPADQFELTMKSILDQTAKEDQLRLAWQILQSSDSPGQRDVALAEIGERFANRSAGKWAALMGQVKQSSAEESRAPTLRLAADHPTLRPAPTVAAVSPFQSNQELVFPSSVAQVSALIPVGVAQPDVIQAIEKSDHDNSDGYVDLEFDFHPAVLMARLDHDSDVAIPNELDGDELDGDDLDHSASSMLTSESDLQRLVVQGQASWRKLVDQYSANQFVAVRTDGRPKLDGVLSESCWKDGQKAGSTTEPLTRIALDDEFIYFAVSVKADQIEEAGGNANVQPKPRDHDLTKRQRLSIRIDTDQDLWNSYHLQMTQSKQGSEGINDNLSWHPEWYFASSRAGRYVHFEVAIKQRDLARLSPLAGGPTANDSLSRPPGEDWGMVEDWSVSVRLLSMNQPSESGLFPKPSDWRGITTRSAVRKANPPAHATPTRLAPIR